MKISFSAKSIHFVLLAIIGMLGLLTTSCKKDDPEIKDYSGIDQGLITDYLAAKNITTAQKQPSGLYFLPVTTNPNGVKVTKNMTVSVLYTGHLLDAAGTVFDASSKRNNVPLIFVVGANQIIPGFDEGISLMHVGDKAELIIPSGLAYASQSSGSIPANAVLRFEVEVLDVAAVDDQLITNYLSTRNITTAQKQASGLYFLPVTTNHSGVRPVIGNTVKVLYTGHLLDATGTVFDASSLNNNTPLSFTFGRGQLIQGFEEGIGLMHKGDKAEILIPSALAYGTKGTTSALIGPNTVLRFELEIVDIK